MPGQSQFRRNVFSQILGISALIAVSIAVGCTTGNGGSGGGGGSPSLAATVAVEGSFSSGEQGAAYTIAVSNTGSGATSGTVTVADPPTGFAATAISGGATWTCTLATTTCTNSNSLAAGQSFATITVTGNVTSANGTPVTIPLILSGGGAATVNVTPTPSVSVAAVALGITKSHTGRFTQGQAGAKNTVTVSNGTGAGTTSGMVTVTETLPSGLFLSAGTMSGSGWTCLGGGAIACDRSDALTGGSSYPPITVTVGVRANATSPQVNQVSVSGGNQTTVVPPFSDSTPITVALPELQITKLHSGNFAQGQTGARYLVTVFNRGAAPTSGTVTVTETLPSGMTPGSPFMAGMGWTCPGAGGANTCDRSDRLAAGGPRGTPLPSYPPITVTVNVGASATSPQVNMAAVSGGGSANGSTSDSTTITAPTCPLTKLGNESLLSGTYIASLNGWEDGGGPLETAGAFVANGAGGVTNGELDSGKVAVGAAQAAPTLETISSGCYQVGLDQRGLMIWNLSGGAGSVTFAFSLGASGQSGHIIEFDDQNPGASPGKRSAGTFFSQTGGLFTLASFSGPLAFYTKRASPNGTNTNYLREGTVGRFDESTTGVVTNGTVNAASATGAGMQTNIDNQIFTGSLTAPDNLGRGTATFTYANFNNTGPLTLNFAYYIQDANDLLVQSTDTPDNTGHGLKHGAINTQANGPYSLGSLSGNAVFYMFGADLSTSHGFTVNGAGLIIGDGHGGASFMLDEVSNGSVVATGTNTISGGSFAVSPNGMGVLTIGSGAGAKSFSIAMYDQNAGVLLEGTAASPGSNVLIGSFESQTAPAGGYADGALSGLYVLGTHLTASTNTAFDVGSVVTPTTQTNPASFSGKTDHISGGGCATNCLSPNQAVSATYSVDANGRITITPTSGGGGTAIGWFMVRNGNRFFFISDTGDANATIMSANH